ncbi:hypothetical protein DAEQUDRAFT_374134 [Daedalea quercina L-15889]|uniref:Uncharacterized protein n=1 Tax=Daedalea quercina L-15889 TaxID=1314783 RepID=A0A165P6S5_9APHY|nr:hypothetical protein DAEQUDRAFT_374134 [Daedalea quercina L-15889]
MPTSTKARGLSTTKRGIGRGTVLARRGAGENWHAGRSKSTCVKPRYTALALVQCIMMSLVCHQRGPALQPPTAPLTSELRRGIVLDLRRLAVLPGWNILPPTSHQSHRSPHRLATRRVSRKLPCADLPRTSSPPCSNFCAPWTLSTLPLTSRSRESRMRGVCAPSPDG